MTEAEAHLVAAEMEYHRWWRVEELIPPLPCEPQWGVRLQSRYNEHVFLRLYRIPDACLIAQLRTWGEENVPPPERAALGLSTPQWLIRYNSVSNHGFETRVAQ